MSDGTPIRLPRENVNDEMVKLTAWLAPDGSSVLAGQAIAEVETSKAEGEITAPTAGVLKHARGAGEEIEIGGVIGYISGDTAPQKKTP